MSFDSSRNPLNAMSSTYVPSTEVEEVLAELANDLEERCEVLTAVVFKLRAKCKRAIHVRQTDEVKRLHGEITRLHGEFSHLVSGE